MTKKKKRAKKKKYGKEDYLCVGNDCSLMGTAIVQTKSLGTKLNDNYFATDNTHIQKHKNKSDYTLNWHLLKIALPRK